MTTDGKTPLLKRKFPQIRGRNIYQLARAGKRLAKIAAGTLRADWDKTPALRAVFQDKIATTLQGQKALKTELTTRNVFGTPFRDATPHKQRNAIAKALAMAA